MLSRWWRARRLARERRRYRPGVWAEAGQGLPLLAGLTAERRQRLEDLGLLFLRDKALEPVQGLVLEERMGPTIALQACLPILELGLEWYRGWYAVILYPAEFVPGHQVEDADGLVWVDTEVKSGEAWDRGPVILSWADVSAPGQGDGYNVVLHEMAHKLDLRDGVANGRPPLHPGMSGALWAREFATAFADLERRASRGADCPLDPYALESPAEFFAVATEAFFETPASLLETYPGVYVQLRAFYRQDPANDLLRAASAHCPR